MWGSGPEITWSDVPPSPNRGVKTNTKTDDARKTDNKYALYVYRPMYICISCVVLSKTGICKRSSSALILFSKCIFFLVTLNLGSCSAETTWNCGVIDVHFRTLALSVFTRLVPPPISCGLSDLSYFFMGL